MLKALAETVRTNVPQLNQQQRIAYDTLIEAVNSGSVGIYFLDAPGGTGKTFLISLASSEIVSTLLGSRRTAHSALNLSLNMQINKTPICNIANNSAMAKILRRSLEALDRKLKDLHGNQNIFAVVMILLSGDFRQALPVIPRSTAADELNVCLKSSNLWGYVKTLQLTTNMRVFLQQDETANLLLNNGNNKVAVDTSTGFITLLTNFCHIKNSKEELIYRGFRDIAQQFSNHNWLGERAILAAKNKDVEDLNVKCIQNFLPGQLVSLKSDDTVVNQDDVLRPIGLTITPPSQSLTSSSHSINSIAGLMGCNSRKSVKSDRESHLSHPSNQAG
ncbi:uncharacterized protein LOC143190865 [Rhynchophorus ferrugineus]|uniref:uncharacterized protein LOC143190865 n=1 Tax=Rhynchophorus ferrugineus TaxID=354439 RepID=UPI003FCC2DEE